MVKPWGSLPPPAPDKIFAVAAKAAAAGPGAINATIGVYADDEGNTALFPSVAAAVKDLRSDLEKQSYGYTPLLGLPEYRSAVTQLLLPEKDLTKASIAATGGTGALAVNLRLLMLLQPEGKLGLSTPAWANHPPLCRMAGIPYEEVPQNSLPEWMRSTKGPCAVLVQAGCTNPTGIDRTQEEWQELIGAASENECIILLDFAYQGFGAEPEADAEPLHMMAEAGIPTLVAWSASKNHSIYRLRTGLALAVVPDPETCATVEAHYSMLSRGLWSTAPSFGQQVVARTQMHHRAEWLSDLAKVRAHLEHKRDVLREHLPKEFHASLNGKGLFAQLPLKKEQILSLREGQNVFLLDDGRINIAGIPDSRLQEFCEKVCSVIG